MHVVHISLCLCLFVFEFFVVISCLILFVLANLSAVAISRPHFGINITRFVSSVLLPAKVTKLPVRRKSKSTCYSSFVDLSSLFRVLPRIVVFQPGTHTILAKLKLIGRRCESACLQTRALVLASRHGPELPVPG